jgi:hypothetical protein
VTGQKNYNRTPIQKEEKNRKLLAIQNWFIAIQNSSGDSGFLN